MANKRKKSAFQSMSPRARLALAVILVALLVVVVIYASGGWLEFSQDIDGALQVSVARSPSPSAAPEKTPGANATTGTLEVYVLDVGQGDSIFLMSPSGKTMLVDASESGMYPQIDAFLTEMKIEKLDIVVGTHPHADHIGGMRKVVENYEIGGYYMPDAVSTSKTFENLLDALEKRNVPVHEALADGDTFIDWDAQVEVRILSPVAGHTYSDLNNASAIVRVKFGDTAILLTGDAEHDAERIALGEYPASYFASTVLKLGHHGSSTSTMQAFFDAVNPSIAVMSLGEGNTYGHPHSEILALLEQAGIPYYRTDESGTVHITLNGSGYSVETEK